MKPLDGAYFRVKRAGVHLTNLNRRVNALSKIIKDSIIVNREPHIFFKEGQEILGFKDEIKFTTQQVPHIIKILIGEIAYNLRAALDYLVYELARLDSGKVTDSTQFLIEETPKDFKKKCGYRLKGVNDKHIAIIEELQPYNGCGWTRTLKYLSNPDKHRKLTLAKNIIEYNPPEISSEAVAIIEGKPVDVNDCISVHVMFSDGKFSMDIDTLKQLKLKVAQTLHIFDSEFK
jgi:hypothetical protein